MAKFAGKFYRADKSVVSINGLFSGASAFLCCSGPSLLNHDLNRLRNIPTLAVNNAPIALRRHGKFSPTFWTMTDDVKNFCASIYEDPRIIKFLPDGKVGNKLWDNNKWEVASKKVQDCPGVLYYRRPPGLEEHFDVKTFLDDTRFHWGNHARRCRCGYVRPEDDKNKKCPNCGEKKWWGSRSCMLVAIRILYELGFKNVFLLGCDFEMKEDAQNYAFEQDRSPGSVTNNNHTYRHLNWRFDQLQPMFRKLDYHVYNCYERSGLKSFPYLSFDDALKKCYQYPINDRTAGLYDRKAKEKERRQKIKTDENMTLAEFVKIRDKTLRAIISRDDNG